MVVIKKIQGRLQGFLPLKYRENTGISSICVCPLVLLIRSQIEIRMVPTSLFGCIVPLLKYVELSSFLWSYEFDDDWNFSVIFYKTCFLPCGIELARLRTRTYVA